MDQTDDLWTAIRRVLPDAEALAAAVAAELGEPLDDVRPSVLIGTIALNGQLGPEATAGAAIEAELSRIQPVTGGRPPGRRFDVDSLDELSGRDAGSRGRRARSTSKRSWRSSALRGRSRRGPIDRWSSCSTATPSPGD